MNENPGLLDREKLQQELDKAKRENDRFKALCDIGTAIASALSPELMFGAIIEGALSITDAEEGVLFLVEPGTDQLYMVAQMGLQDESVQFLRQKVNDSLIASVVRERKAIRLQNTKLITGHMAKSLMCVPLISRGKTLGSIYIDNRESASSFSSEDETFLSFLAGHAAIACNNIQLLDGERQRGRALSGLHELGKDLLSEYEPRTLLVKVTASAQNVLGASVVVLYEYVEEKHDVRMPPIISGDLNAPGILLVRGRIHRDSLVFRILERNMPFYAPNAKEDWTKEGLLSSPQIEEGGGFISREGIISSAGVPLIAGGERVGVLFINYRDAHRFNPDHRERIDIFANHAALAIRNARTLSDAQRYVKELSALSEVGKTISAAAAMKTENILQLIYQQTLGLMDADSFYIAFLEEEDKVRFKFAVEGGVPQKIGEGQWIARKAGNGLTEHVMRVKKPVLLQSESDIDEYLRENGIDKIGSPAKSWLGAPMIAEQKVLGVIAVQNPSDEHAFDHGHARVLLTIASQAAIAIQNERLIRKAQQEAQGLERLIESSPLGIIVADREGLVERINQEALDTIGYSKNEVLQHKVNDLYANPQTPYDVANELDSSLRGRILRYPTSVRAKAKEGQEEGEEIPILLSATWLYDIEGNRVGSAGYFQDLRQLRATEQALEKSHRTAQVIAKVLALGDAESTLISVAKGTLEALSCDNVVLFPYDQAKGNLIYPPKFEGDINADSLQPIDRRLLDSALNRMLQHDEPYVADATEVVVFFKGTISTKEIDIRTPLAIPLAAGGKKVGIMLVNYRNPHRFEEHELKTIQLFANQAAVAIYNAQLYENARKLEQKSKQFVQDVMHQLVGPLSGLRAHCENLMRGRVTVERGRVILETIVEQGGMLQRYARNFGFSARGDDTIFKESELDPKLVKPQQLIEILVKCAKSFQGQAKAKELGGPSIDELSFREFPNLWLDEDLFEIAVMNLYDNAVKYSFEGAPITIQGRKLNGSVEIIVTNHGIELLPDQTEIIFQRYTRSDQAKEAVPIGTGIGLFICKQIMKLHRGDIRAEPSIRSLYGNEVRFIMKLPSFRSWSY